MITSGRRRSVRPTAVSPSGASPTTRMCGERSRASRRPSRTTSWSSASRTVISGPPVSRSRGDSTVRRGRCDQTRVSCVGWGAAEGRVAMLATLGGELRTRSRAARVSRSGGRSGPRRVVRSGRAPRRPVARERLEEVLPGAWAEVEMFAQMWCAPASRAARTVSSSCAGRRRGRGGSERGRRSSGSRRRRGDGRLEPAAGRGRAGLRGPPHPVVEGQHRDVHRHLRPSTDASSSTSTSRQTSGPRVMIVVGVRACESSTRQARVRR